MLYQTKEKEIMEQSHQQIISSLQQRPVPLKYGDASMLTTDILYCSSSFLVLKYVIENRPIEDRISLFTNFGSFEKQIIKTNGKNKDLLQVRACMTFLVTEDPALREIKQNGLPKDEEIGRRAQRIFELAKKVLMEGKPASAFVAEIRKDQSLLSYQTDYIVAAVRQDHYDKGELDMSRFWGEVRFLLYQARHNN